MYNLTYVIPSHDLCYTYRYVPSADSAENLIYFSAK